MIAMTDAIYKLKNVNDRHLMLQSPTGGLRVVRLEGVSARRTAAGYEVSTPQVIYPISHEDYLRLSPLLKLSA